MRVNSGMQPAGGWVYPISDTVKLEGFDKESLAKAIASYRMRAGIDPGNPERDIDNYICGKYPHSCIREYGDTLAPNHFPGGPPPVATLNSRVALWAAIQSQSIPPGGHQLVHAKTATERAKICSICPRNQNWKTRCGSCNATAEQILGTVRKLNRTPSDDQLMGCEVFGYDNRTAVWLDLPVGTDHEKSFLPAACWRMK